LRTIRGIRVLFFRKKEPWFDLLSLNLVLQLTNQTSSRYKLAYSFKHLFGFLTCWHACSCFKSGFFHL